MPDFVLVKVDSSSEPAKDIPLLVLEVKRSLATELEREHGISQLRDYMIEFSLRKPPKAFRGILLASDRFFRASLVQRSVPFTRMSNTRNGEGLKPSKYFLQYLLKQKAGISNTIYDVCVND